ncbi:flagellar hook protein FlgE [Larsenimonas suaedae]|uniref:Flagellar hook protein FlgE n=1 Tax=Larsenimonas suaedae TaxID=1851019 RepID=A0ABU1GUC4_9GAMM|nr:flagellar hook protein FlgE [Larsenimonas suaedae]MCM2971624.1 flagellar hook protein FlgE [Larsenimonas suaedae]MDR5895176.1 flagellar hook protein FlgE [Larsenimonas suaedae]
MSFSQGVSGINAASSNLDVIGNNIANSATVGYKSSRAEFADIYAGAKGLGTKVAAITQSFSSGSIETTDRDLDLAINGDGFFRFNDGAQTTYSRNGQLTLTKDGFLANATGARLTGYQAQGNGVVLTAENAAAAKQALGGQPAALEVPTDNMPSKATEAGGVVMNLDSNSVASTPDTTVAGANGINPGNDASYNFTTTMTAYDSLGNTQPINLYFSKNSANPNEWTVTAFNDDNVVGTNNAVQFDSNGQLNPAGQNLNVAFTPAGGGAAMNFDVSFDGTTQFGDDFAVNDISQDGYTSGALTGISIDDDGSLIASYSNDQTKLLGQVALANFRNTQGLQPVGDNGWVETSDSGQPLLGKAGTGQLGGLVAGAVENSNVDLSSQLVNMIVAQRNYQANAQTIKTQDQVLQTLVTLR